MHRYTPITLDKARNLRYNLAALRYVEEQTGRSFLHGFSLEKVEDIAIVLYAGLRHEDASLTLDIVEDMIDIDQLPYIGEQIKAAFSSAAPKAEPNDNRPPVAIQDA